MRKGISTLLPCFDPEVYAWTASVASFRFAEAVANRNWIWHALCGCDPETAILTLLPIGTMRCLRDRPVPECSLMHPEALYKFGRRVAQSLRENGTLFRLIPHREIDASFLVLFIYQSYRLLCFMLYSNKCVVNCQL